MSSLLFFGCLFLVCLVLSNMERAIDRLERARPGDDYDDHYGE